jgi:hypothetical protein
MMDASFLHLHAQKMKITREYGSHFLMGYDSLRVPFYQLLACVFILSKPTYPPNETIDLHILERIDRESNHGSRYVLCLKNNHLFNQEYGTPRSTVVCMILPSVAGVLNN